jgi:hypothetical protein
MDRAWSAEGGFTLTTRVLGCCGTATRLDALGSDPLCAFGSFAIEITDTTTTLSESAFDSILRELETSLACRLQRVDAHY